MRKRLVKNERLLDYKPLNSANFLFIRDKPLLLYKNNVSNINFR